MDSTPGTFELLKRLNDAGVDYVIVGGIAAILHGSPRMTIDIDVCAPLTEPNLSRILLVLRGLHPKFRMRPDKLPMPDDASRLQGFKNLNLDTDLGILDILTEITGVGSFQDVFKESESKDVDGIPCRVLKLHALIASKRAANRAKDRLAVVELEALRQRIERRSQP